MCGPKKTMMAAFELELLIARLVGEIETQSCLTGEGETKLAFPASITKKMTHTVNIETSQEMEKTKMVALKPGNSIFGISIIDSY